MYLNLCNYKNQSQSLEVFYEKSYSQKFYKIHRKKTCARVCGTGVFPVSCAKFLKTPFLKKNFAWLLLKNEWEPFSALFFETGNC